MVVVASSNLGRSCEGGQASGAVLRGTYPLNSEQHYAIEPDGVRGVGRAPETDDTSVVALPRAHAGVRSRLRITCLAESR